jgi:hypothetical protein
MLAQDALLDEEGAQLEDGFGAGANAVSFKVPAAQASQAQSILGAQEAHEACSLPEHENDIISLMVG